MGLLDKFKGQDSELDPAEGVIGIALSAVAADGLVTQDEATTLTASLSRMALFQDMGQRQVSRAFERVYKIAKNDGVETLLKRSADAVPEDLKETTFAIATDLLFSDGAVDATERAFLEDVRRALGVDDERAERIVEVLELKNRG